MRTTIDLPDDLHQLARFVARDTSQSLSATIVDLIRRGLSTPAGEALERSGRTGLPVVRVGRVITSEDVRSLDDDLA